jgi:hypothetical protein
MKLLSSSKSPLTTIKPSEELALVLLFLCAKIIEVSVQKRFSNTTSLAKINKKLPDLFERLAVLKLLGIVNENQIFALTEIRKLGNKARHLTLPSFAEATYALALIDAIWPWLRKCDPLVLPHIGLIKSLK